MKRLILYSTILLTLSGCTLVGPGNSGVDPTPPVVTSNQSPIALYSISHRIPYTGQEVVFDGTYSRDGDGWIVAWRWDLGPAGIQTGSIVTVTFDTPGDFAITLTVTDNDGATDSIYRRIKVEVPSQCGTNPGGGCPGGTCLVQ